MQQKKLREKILDPKIYDVYIHKIIRTSQNYEEKNIYGGFGHFWSILSNSVAPVYRHQ